jgi:hypothetical protein
MAGAENAPPRQMSGPNSLTCKKRWQDVACAATRSSKRVNHLEHRVGSKAVPHVKLDPAAPEESGRLCGPGADENVIGRNAYETPFAVLFRVLRQDPGNPIASAQQELGSPIRHDPRAGGDGRGQDPAPRRGARTS